MLGEDLGVDACRLPSNRGVQFGSDEKACYVTVFDNGTILSQSIMGFHYGVDVIATKLIEKFQMRSQDIKCSKMSQKFKQCLRMFSNELHPEHQESMAKPDPTIAAQSAATPLES